MTVDVILQKRDAIHRARVARHLSPLPGGCVIAARPCLRRGVGGPIHRPRGKRTAPGRRADGSRSGGPWRPLPPEPQHEAEPATALSGSRCERASGQRSRRGSQSSRRGTEIAARGCRKAAQGPEQGLREPDGVPREARNQASRAGWYRPQGCRRGTRVPVAPPALLPGTDGACAEQVSEMDCPS